MRAFSPDVYLRDFTTYARKNIAPWDLVEFWSGLSAIAWAGLSVFYNADLAAWPSMHVLLALLDERAWHTLAFCLGAAQLMFLVFREEVPRIAGALLIAAFYATLALGMWAAADWQRSPWLSWAALAGGWSALNISRALYGWGRHGRSHS